MNVTFAITNSALTTLSKTISEKGRPLHLPQPTTLPASSMTRRLGPIVRFGEDLAQRMRQRARDLVLFLVPLCVRRLVAVGLLLGERRLALGRLQILALPLGDLSALDAALGALGDTRLAFGRL